MNKKNIMSPLLAAGCIGWVSQSGAGELIQVLITRESWQAGQPSYHPSPEPGLWDGPLQQLWTVGGEGDEPIEIQNSRMSTVQGNIKISKGSPDESPLSVV